MLFIFDENFPPEFVKGFSILETANKRSNIQVDVVFSVDFMNLPERRSVTDEEIIEKASQKNAVIITHDIPCARITADRVMIMSNGEFVAEGSCQELENAADPFIRSFFK